MSRVLFVVNGRRMEQSDKMFFISKVALDQIAVSYIKKKAEEEKGQNGNGLLEINIYWVEKKGD